MAVSRRTFLHSAGALGLSACHRAPTEPSRSTSSSIALLHLAPDAGDVEKNRQSLLSATQRAAQAGASLILTPELAVSGYSFSDKIGTDWIRPQPDGWVEAVQNEVRKLGVTLILGLPERDPETELLHNSMLAIGPDGDILGRHRKNRTLKVGSEAWSSPGTPSKPVAIPSFGQVGMFICADAVDEDIALGQREQGANLLVSSANWAPGLYGPNGEWERSSAASSLPLIVCNRTGVGRTLDFSGSESVVVCQGERRMSLTSTKPAIFLIDWDHASNDPQGSQKIIL